MVAYSRPHPGKWGNQSYSGTHVVKQYQIIIFCSLTQLAQTLEQLACTLQLEKTQAMTHSYKQTRPAYNPPPTGSVDEVGLLLGSFQPEAQPAVKYLQAEVSAGVGVV